MAENNIPNKEKSPIEILLDCDNNDNIVLYDAANRAVEFEQVALIPLNNAVHAILKPANEMQGVGPDEALVLTLNEDCLVVTEDEETINAVFEAYYEALRESGVDC